MSDKPPILRDARREDVPIIVRMLADDPLGSTAFAISQLRVTG